MGINCIPSIFFNQRRNKNRRPASLDHGINIRLHQRNRWLPIDIVGLIRSNSNQWFHSLIVKQKTPRSWNSLGSFVKFLVKFLFEAGGFAGAATHEIELGTANNTMAFHHHFVNTGRTKQKGAFDTDAIGSHASHRDRVVIATLAYANDSAFELLNTFAVTFFDLDMNTDIIASFHGGYFFILFGLESLDDIYHSLSSLRL